MNSAMRKISNVTSKIRYPRCSTRSLYKRAIDQIDPECSIAVESFESLTRSKVKFAADTNFAPGRDSALYCRSTPTYKPGKWSYDSATEYRSEADCAADNSRGWAYTSFMTNKT
jgi:hypothetical protein